MSQVRKDITVRQKAICALPLRTAKHMSAYYKLIWLLLSARSGTIQIFMTYDTAYVLVFILLDGVRAMIRVLVADGHPIFREGLKCVLDRADEIKVCGESTNGVEALKKTPVW